MSFKVNKCLDKNVKVFLEDLLNNKVKSDPYEFCNLYIESCYLPNTIRTTESYVKNNPLTLGPCTLHSGKDDGLVRTCSYNYIDLNFKRNELSSRFFYEELDNEVRNKIVRGEGLSDESLNDLNIPSVGLSVKFKTNGIDVYSLLVEVLYGMSLHSKEVINNLYTEIPYKLYIEFENPVLEEDNRQEIEELLSLL